MLSNPCSCACLCSPNPDGFWCAHVRTVPIRTKQIYVTICYMCIDQGVGRRCIFIENSIASWNRDNGKTKKRSISHSTPFITWNWFLFPWVPFVAYPPSNFMPMISCVIAFSCMLMLNDKIMCAPARSMHWDQRKKRKKKRKTYHMAHFNHAHRARARRFWRQTHSLGGICTDTLNATHEAPNYRRPVLNRQLY